MPDELTACKNCAHFRRAGRPNDVWYNHICGASPLAPQFSYLSGTFAVPPPLYHYCRDINTDGDCRRFEPAEGPAPESGRNQ